MIIREFTTGLKTESFSCGKPELDIYLKKQAGQDKRRGYASVFVALEPGASERIIGFYTLSAASINLSRLPDDEIRKLPRYPEVPAIRLGRLAVDKSHQGQKIGQLLLLDSIRRSCASEIAWAFFLVEAMDEKARDFYKKFYFMVFADNEMAMWLKRKQADRLASMLR